MATLNTLYTPQTTAPQPTINQMVIAKPSSAIQLDSDPYLYVEFNVYKNNTPIFSWYLDMGEVVPSGEYALDLPLPSIDAGDVLKIESNYSDIGTIPFSYTADRAIPAQKWKWVQAFSTDMESDGYYIFGGTLAGVGTTRLEFTTDDVIPPEIIVPRRRRMLIGGL